jgi:hypothetical protein
MDAKDRDESKTRRREETLARRVGEALDQMNPSGMGECPDAEVIAAYSDHGLASDETVRWESHFVTCARCRNVLRVLAASADTPLAESEVARLGELVAAARVPAAAAAEPAKVARPWAWDWRVRWLAPALGVATVFAVWFAIRPPWRGTGQSASTTLIAQIPKALPPAVSGPADQLPPGLPLEDKQALKSRSPQSNRQSPVLDSRGKITAGGPAAARDELGTATGNGIAAYNALQKKGESNRPANDREDRLQARLAPPPPPPAPPAPAAQPQIATGESVASAQSNAKSSADLSSQAPAMAPAPAAVPAPPPPPPSPTKAAAGALARSAPVPEVRAKADTISPAAPEPPQQASQTVTVTEAAPVVETANGTVGSVAQPGVSTDVPINGRNYQSLILPSPAQKSATLFKAPSGSVLWRTASGGKIERSNDSGRSWQTQVSPSQEDWLSGGVVSDTVCWLAGRNGAIARTVDGQRWDSVAAPAQATGSSGKLPDWTGIVARDAQAATVTASDGRRFATSDGGKTWQALP